MSIADRNKQKQLWVEVKDLIRLRQHKGVKNNGKVETDAEAFKKVLDEFEKNVQKIDLKIKLDKRSLF